MAPTSQRTSPYWLLLQLIPRLIEFIHGEGEGLSELSRQRRVRGSITERHMLPSIVFLTDVTLRFSLVEKELLKIYLFLLL